MRAQIKSCLPEKARIFLQQQIITIMYSIFLKLRGDFFQCAMMMCRCSRLNQVINQPSAYRKSMKPAECKESDFLNFFFVLP